MPKHRASHNAEYLIDKQKLFMVNVNAARINARKHSITKSWCFAFILSLFYLCTFPSVAAIANPFQYITEELKPLSHSTEKGKSGLAVDILGLVWKQAGWRAADITILPWARAELLLQNEDTTVLFTMVRTSEREKQYQWACMDFNIEIVLISKKASAFDVSNVSDLENYTIGTNRNGIADKLLSNTLTNSKNLVRNALASKNFKILLKNRIDMFAYPRIGFPNLVSSFGLEISDFEPVFTIIDKPACFAFNLNEKKNNIEKFKASLEFVMATPAYKKLKKQYIHSF